MNDKNKGVSESSSAESSKKPFWLRLSLSEMSAAQWESLCDGCGLCCLTKLEDEDTGELVYTRVVCEWSDPETAACSDYANRSVNVPGCVALTPERVAEFDWLPDTCGYRRVYQGRDLADWHPLKSGDRRSVKQRHQGLHGIRLVVDQPGLDYEDYVIPDPD